MAFFNEEHSAKASSPIATNSDPLFSVSPSTFIKLTASKVSLPLNALSAISLYVSGTYNLVILLLPNVFSPISIAGANTSSPLYLLPLALFRPLLHQKNYSISH